MSNKNMNAILLMLFLFIPSITTPLKIISGNGYSVWILTTIIIIISIKKDSFKINKQFFYMIFILNFIFLLNILLVSYKDIVIDFYKDFLIYSTISLYLTYKDIDYEYLLKNWYKIGIINLFIWLIFWNVIIDKVNYMYLGSSLLLSFTIIYYNFLKKRNLIDVLLIIIIYILLMIFGSRGSFLTANIVVIILLLYKLRYKYIFGIITISIFIILSLFIDYKLVIYNILNSISYKISSLGFNSYSINKFILMLSDGLVESSSGRDYIYRVTNQILQEGLIPRGIGYFQSVTGINYPHNFILDVLIIFGFLAIPLFIYIIIKIIYFFLSNYNTAKKDVVLLLLIITLGRLSLSSTFIHEVTFWVLFGIITYKRNFNKTDAQRVMKE